MNRAVKTNQGHYHLKIKKGLDLKIAGEPFTGESPVIVEDPPVVTRVGLVGDDYPMLKPSFVVSVGDVVKTGQVLFFDRERPAIKFTSPGHGTVVEINRGEKRKFESIVIALTQHEGENSKDENRISYQKVVFNKYDPRAVKDVTRDEIMENLLASGLWTSLRNRPFGIIADPSPDISGQPHSIFITAVDTHPHCPPPGIFIAEHRDKFELGVYLVSKLTGGKTWVVKKESSELAGLFSASGREFAPENLAIVNVEGPHPSGNAGTHIHFLDPVGTDKNVWYINYQDVIAVGCLFATGELFTERLISICGPGCSTPALIKTRLGASIDELVSGRKKKAEPQNGNMNEIRTISGSLLSGNTAEGVKAYLGRYHRQVSLVEEGRQRKFLGWLSAGINRFSIKNIYVENFIKLFRHVRTYEFNTSTNGSSRAMVPIEIYDKVMPLDIQPVFLLRALLTGDIEQAGELGVLELEEEDLDLCTFVSPGKDDFGYLLRAMLNRIKKGE